MADVVDLTNEPDVIDLTDGPEAKRQNLSKAHLDDELLGLVYKQLPLREKMRAALLNLFFKSLQELNAVFILGDTMYTLSNFLLYTLPFLHKQFWIHVDLPERGGADKIRKLL
eukprot:SAG22_NODE_524_length_9488_cov_16.150602_6_plen_113_part_00